MGHRLAPSSRKRCDGIEGCPHQLRQAQTLTELGPTWREILDRHAVKSRPASRETVDRHEVKYTLVDTGAIVGLLDDKDRHHERAEEFFDSLRPADKLLTTWPVITECSFLLRQLEDKFWDWLLDSDVQIIEFTLGDVPDMRTWRAGYADREVDFADATLAWLGDKRHTNGIPI